MSIARDKTHAIDIYLQKIILINLMSINLLNPSCP